MAEGIKPLKQHLAEVEAAERLLRMTRQQGATADQRAKMAAHSRAILEYYAGVDDVTAFLDPAGRIYDVIPAEQQGALRGQQDGLAKAPNCPGWEQEAEDKARSGVQGQLAETRLDQFGNAVFAPTDTIPVRRPMPEDVLHPPMSKRGLPSDYDADGNLHLRKSDSGRLGAVVGSEFHYHAVSGDAAIPNVGGHGVHSLHKPVLNVAGGQSLSLSQQWWVAGTGSGLQTFEFGWIVDVTRNGNTDPGLFFNTTNDNYQTRPMKEGVGPGSPFVQTNNLWASASSLSPWSVVDGTQRYLACGAFLSDGKWWLYLGGKAAENAVCYLPASWWNGGGALASGAAHGEWGGEVAGHTPSSGTRGFGAMGAGQHANTGLSKSAYVRNMQVFTSATTTIIPSALTFVPFSTHPGYTAQINGYASPWNRTLWFGGPGGTVT